MKIPAIPTQLKGMQVDKVWQAGYTGRGIGVAVLDSGDPSHPDLDVVTYQDFIQKNPETPESRFHGVGVATSVAGNGRSTKGMLSGTAPEADIVGIRIGEPSGHTNPGPILQGINWAIDNREKYNIRVINLSCYLDGWDEKKKSQVYDALKEASELGIVPVVAAGNQGDLGMNKGMAELDYVVTVGSTAARAVSAETKENLRNGTGVVQSMSSFSGVAPEGIHKPDVVAPGSNVLVGSPEGSYWKQSGTSFATPMVSGVIATWLQANPTLGVHEVRDIIAQTSLPVLDVPARKIAPFEQQGHGLIQAKAGLDLAQQMKGPVPLRMYQIEQKDWTPEMMQNELELLKKNQEKQ